MTALCSVCGHARGFRRPAQLLGRRGWGGGQATRLAVRLRVQWGLKHTSMKNLEGKLVNDGERAETLAEYFDRWADAAGPRTGFLAGEAAVLLGQLEHIDGISIRSLRPPSERCVSARLGCPKSAPLPR